PRDCLARTSARFGAVRGCDDKEQLESRYQRAGWPRNCRRSACWLLRATLLPGLLSEPNPSWPSSNGALVRRLALKSCVNARLTAAVRVVLCAAHHSSSSRSRVLGNLTFRAIASLAVLRSGHSVLRLRIPRMPAVIPGSGSGT